MIEQAAQDLIVDGKEGSSENVIKEVPESFADVSGAVSRDGVNTLVEDMLNAGIISGADKSYEKGELHYIVSVSDQGHNFKSDVFHYEKNTADIIRMNLRVAVDQWADIPEAEATGTDSLQRNMSAIYTVSFALSQGEWKILDFEAPTGEPEKLSASLLTDNVTIDYNEISSKFTRRICGAGRRCIERRLRYLISVCIWRQSGWKGKQPFSFTKQGGCL